MPMIFPSRFRPHEWVGWRAREYPRREDAFQQLVGDGLRELVGLRAHVSPTLGRDGNIDVFVESGETAAERMLGLPLPLVVECKDHDDSARSVRANVDEGWRRVADKLVRQARQRWPGAFQPWRRARSFVYAISAILPNQQARGDLQERIRAFFNSLGPEERVPVDDILVLDWSDIRDWLDRMPRLVDRWLGTGVAAIVPHSQFLDQLAGFRRYLTPAGLPFVSPHVTAPSHPDRLLEAVDRRAGEGGVLLVGVGGIGKTRTVMEVGTRAESRGWRVLHIRAGEPTVETEELDDAVLAGAGSTLVILDYVDQLQRIDPGHLRHRLLPESCRRGVRLALLATARPGALPGDHAEWMRLFEQIQVTRSPADTEAVARAIRSTLAPTALAQLGDSHVRQLCGERPIIAMFIAEEMERRAVAGTLGQGELEGLRAGDLVGWLRKRLAESHLTVPVTTRILPPEPDEAVIACAAVLACAPDSRASLLSVAQPIFGRRGQFAELVVDSLLALGWLESSAAELSAAHDVVADEVLDQILRARPSDALRAHVLSNVLDTISRRPRSLGRFVTTLDRMLQSGPSTEPFATSMSQTCTGWARAHATALGMIFVDADADEASYALGATAASSLFAASLFEQWDVMAGPWLDRHGSRIEARHLLYVGLRHAPVGTSGLLASATSWLGVNATILQATFVIGPMLGRPDLTTAQSASTIGRALSWLATHGLTAETQFVLHPLLGRSDLTSAQAANAIDRALRWLATHGLTAEASFVLSRMLGRWDLTDAQAASAIERALGWLATHGLTGGAQFVLGPLLGRSDLGGVQATDAVDRALAWLTTHGLSAEAQFVLHRLLGRADLSRAHATNGVDRALGWLATHGLTAEAAFVLPPLLNRTDLRTDQVASALGRALAWLDDFAAARDAEFVFRQLLTRRELSNDIRGRAAARALDRLETIFGTPESSFLLRWVLRVRGLPSDVDARAVTFALQWLDAHAHEDDIDFAANRLLRRPALPDITWLRVARTTIAWLRRTPHADGRDHALFSCLQRADLLSAEDREYLSRDAEAFLDAFAVADSFGRQLRALVSRAAAPAGDAPSRPTADDLELSATLRSLAEAPEVPVPNDLFRRGLQVADDLLADGRPGAAGYYLAPLLSLVERFDSSQSPRVLELCIRMLNHPLLHHRSRAGFLHACGRLVVTGAERNDLLARVITEASRGASSDLQLSESLWQAASRSDPVPPRLVEQGAENAERLLDRDDPRMAGYSVAPLLPLAARLGRERVVERVTTLARRLMAHSHLSTRQRDGFRDACQRLLDAGAWPSSERGRALLTELGALPPAPGDNAHNDQSRAP
jgi:hypothetical protein